MRVNVYVEELTSDVTVVSTTADTGVTYYGVRTFFKSASALHFRSGDDDRSAVTYWVGSYEYAVNLAEQIARSDIFTYLRNVEPAVANYVEDITETPNTSGRAVNAEETTAAARWTCNGAANMRGGHIPCDAEVPHQGWPHTNRKSGLQWQGGNGS